MCALPLVRFFCRPTWNQWGGVLRCVGLQECPVAHLDDLALYVAAHLAGQEQTGIGLVHGIALGSGEVDEVAAVLQHFGTAGLLSGLVARWAGVTVAPGATALQRMLVSIRRMATFFVNVFRAPLVEV